MPVTEGLRCRFLRHVVAVDLDIGMLVLLGKVRKDLVETPDVEGAFTDT